MGWFTRRRVETLPPVQVRTPRGGTQTASYHVPGTRMLPTWDASLAVDRGYHASVAVYRCVNAISSALVRSPFRAGADPDDPKDFNPRSPLALLLGPSSNARGLAGRPAGSANPTTSAHSLWRWTVAQWLVTGRFGWEIDATRQGRPAALWPLVSRLITPVPSGPRSEQYFSEFLYGMPQTEVRFRPQDVVYGWIPSQSDWREPESPLISARLPISVVVAQGTYDYAFLNNGGVPAHMVVHPRIDDDEKREQWRRQFTAEHQGPSNAGRVAFTEYDSYGDGKAGDALHVVQLGQTNRDQQADTRYERYSDEVYIALGTPRSIAGDASGRTFDNASQEYLTWHENTVEPLAQELAGVINTQLAPLLGSDVGWFDFSAVHGRRQRFTAVEGVQLVNAGIVSKEEAREELGLDGELPPELEQQPEAEPVIEVPNDISGLETAPPAPSERSRSTDPQVRRVKLWTDTDRRITAHEVTFARAMTRLFRRQETAVLSRLQGKRGRQALRDDQIPTQAAALFDTAFWTAETEETAQELYEQVFASGGARAAEALGVTLDLTAPFAEEFVRARANQLAGPVVQTTYDAIKEELADGIGHGEDIPQLADRVRGVFNEATRVRSVRIARTEVVSAFNGSAQQVALQLDESVAAGREWIATPDSRTREDHRAADGQVVPLRTPFAVGGHALEYPGDPSAPAGEVVNCRCTLAFLTPEEMAERSRPVPITRARSFLSLVAAGTLRSGDLRSWLESA